MLTTIATTVAILILITLTIAAKKAKKTQKSSDDDTILTAGSSTSTLAPKKPLSKPEQTLYWNLVKAFPDNVVLSQVSFGRFLKAEGESKKENFSKLATVRQKVADYVICDKSFQILGIVELDDKSHNKEKDNKRDELLNEANITVFRYDVKDIPAPETLKTDIKFA